MFVSSTIFWDVKNVYIFALLKPSYACSVFIISIGIIEDALFQLSTCVAVFRNTLEFAVPAVKTVSNIFKIIFLFNF